MNHVEKLLQIKNFKDKFRQFRKAVGLSQQKLAEILGIGRTTLADIENPDKGLPTIEFLFNAFKNNIDLNSFFSDGPIQNRDHESTETANQAIIENYTTMVTSQLQARANEIEIILSLLTLSQDDPSLIEIIKKLLSNKDFRDHVAVETTKFT